MPRAYPTLFDRLVAHVRIEGDCWTWTGTTRRHNGGHRPALSMRVPGVRHPRLRNAARVMLEVIHGSIGPELEASHLCRGNWLCVCPDHLIPETKQNNIRRRDEPDLSDERFDPDIDAPGVRTYTIEAPF